MIIRDARREDVPAILGLLADDVLGAAREGDLDDAYWTAFEQVQADPRNRIIVAEIDRRAAATLQLTLIPGSAGTACSARRSRRSASRPASAARA